MQSKIFTVSWVNIKSALVTAFMVGLLAMVAYILKVGDIFNLNIHTMANVGALAFLGFIGSTFKSFFTTSEGKFAGVVKVSKEK